MFTYEIFLNPVFWMLYGALIVLFFMIINRYVKELNVRMKWWMWLLFAAWFSGLIFVVAGGFTLLGENEWNAGLYFLGIFCTVFLVMGVGLWRLIKQL